MTTTPECPHGEVHPSACLDCVGSQVQPRQPEQPSGTMPPWLQPAESDKPFTIAAMYPGVCEGCGDPIDEGDEIGNAGGSVWVHSECL